MIGYILQLALLIGFLYIITFKMKKKSALIYTYTVIIALLAIGNVMFNILMIYFANNMFISETFARVYLFGQIKYISSIVIVFLTLFTAFTVSLRASNTEDINKRIKKKHGDDTVKIELEKVSIKDYFPEKCRELVVPILCVFLTVTIAITVLFAEYNNPSEYKSVSSFEDLDINCANQDDLNKAIKLLNTIENETDTDNIKIMLEHLYSGDSIKLVSYHENISLCNNDETLRYTQENVGEYIPDSINFDYYRMVRTEIGVYDIAIFEYFLTEDNSVSRNICVISFGSSYPYGWDESPVELANILLIEYSANLGYSFIDYRGSMFGYERVCEFIDNEYLTSSFN